MIVCVPVTPTGEIDPRWGRAARVAVAGVLDGGISSWEEFEVGWDTLHDVGSEGGHHARVARFLLEHGAEVVVADHMGDPMLNMLAEMGVDVRLGAGGDARAAVLAAKAGRADPRELGSR
jgi:predicted Fe-Mo cluster-binding NifX family protein